MIFFEAGGGEKGKRIFINLVIIFFRFTRFFLGQKVHARHRLRFYDARVITVRQPTLQEIAKELKETYDIAKSTPNTMVPELTRLTVENMGEELKNTLKKLVNDSQCFVHYLGWNLRYDEWLMLHKVRVDMPVSFVY